MIACSVRQAQCSVEGHSSHFSRISNEFQVATIYHVQYSLGRKESEGYGLGDVRRYVHLHFR